ncbi:MAG: ribonuclease HI [Phycisphaerae bacterium]
MKPDARCELPEPPDVMLFTDGACSGNPGPGGWGLILRHRATGKEKRMAGGEPHTTNNRMELTAVIRGLEALNTTQPWRVCVVTDSRYVTQGMTEWIEGWIANGWRRGKKPNAPPVKNADLWQALDALCRRHDVTFQHVAGHAGHPENEACDRMAVAAIKKAANS